MTRWGDSKTGNQGLHHLNGHVMCAMDCETTGLIPGTHDIVEVAILPLDAKFKMMRDVPFFHCYLHPKRPQNITEEAMKKNKLDMTEIMLKGLDPWLACDLFDNWFDRLKLAPGKRLVPLTKNWPFDKPFFQDWLGRETVEQRFDGNYRDIGVVSLFFNDRADFHADKPPFPHNQLKDLCRYTGVTLDKAHRALQDAAATAEVYAKFMTHYLQDNPRPNATASSQDEVQPAASADSGPPPSAAAEGQSQEAKPGA